MKVLLSVKPEFASKIFDGSKRYEYRRTIFRQDKVTTIVVYASEPIKRVIGEFEIGEILHEEPKLLWAKTGKQGGIGKRRFLEYFADKNLGFAIRVKEPRKYYTPFLLSELNVFCAPQSFRYLL